MSYTLAVVGCGTMGIAILSGVLQSLAWGEDGKDEQSNGSLAAATTTTATPRRFIACVRRESSAETLRKTFETYRRQDGRPAVEVVHGEAGNAWAMEQGDVVLLCSKPHIAREILQPKAGRERIAAALDGKLLISILSGVTLEMLQVYVPASCQCLRAMPNVPSKIREGMTVLATTPGTSAHHQDLAQWIFQSVGRCRLLDEKHFDACTALCGCGPAFASVFLEAMADGGVMMGLPRAEALELAAQTMQGAARMVLQTGQHPAALKDSVTTPGGCTIAGILVLEDGRVRSTIARAIETSTQVAGGLGRK